MCKKLFAVALLAAASLLISGCQTNSARAIKMQGQSGKMNRYNDYSYYAICKDTSATSHTNVWKGPLWREKERAMQDAYDHNQTNAGHHAKVEVN
jgi:outer membrane lipoprotein-sorting protein